MPFIASSDVLPRNRSDDVPFLDSNNDIDTVQVLCINTLNIISDQLEEYTELPEPEAVLVPDLSPTVNELVTIDVKAITHDENVTLSNADQVCIQFDNGACYCHKSSGLSP